MNGGWWWGRLSALMMSMMMWLNDVLQSGTSFSGRRRSRSPSPVGIGVRSRSMDGRMPKITVDRTPSDESLASSCAQMSMTSPGSHSSSPRSPISPPWSSAASASAATASGGGGGARSPSKSVHIRNYSYLQNVTYKRLVNRLL